MRNYRYILLLLPLVNFISCDEGEEVYTKEAILKWTGDYAVDGCGFFLEIDNKEYKPENEDSIGDEFKKNDSSLVLIKFFYLERQINYSCGDLPGQLKSDGIKIISIERF